MKKAEECKSDDGRCAGTRDRFSLCSLGKRIGVASCEDLLQLRNGRDATRQLDRPSTTRAGVERTPKPIIALIS